MRIEARPWKPQDLIDDLQEIIVGRAARSEEVQTKEAKINTPLGFVPHWQMCMRADKHGDIGWKGLAAVPWRRSREEAQADLDKLAKEKGWKEWNG